MPWPELLARTLVTACGVWASKTLSCVLLISPCERRAEKLLPKRVTSGLSVTASVSRHGTATANFTVANTGTRAGTAVVPVYVRQPVSDVIAPPQRLVGFTRVELGVAASQPEHVSFPVSELAVTPADINSSRRPEVEPGAYQVQVGSQTANFSITG